MTENLVLGLGRGAARPFLLPLSPPPGRNVRSSVGGGDRAFAGRTPAIRAAGCRAPQSGDGREPSVWNAQPMVGWGAKPYRWASRATPARCDSTGDAERATPRLSRWWLPFAFRPLGDACCPCVGPLCGPTALPARAGHNRPRHTCRGGCRQGEGQGRTPYPPRPSAVLAPAEKWPRQRAAAPRSGRTRRLARQAAPRRNLAGGVPDERRATQGATATVCAGTTPT